MIVLGLERDLFGVFEHGHILGVYTGLPVILLELQHQLLRRRIAHFTEKLSVRDRSVAALEKGGNQDGDHLLPFAAQAGAPECD